MTFLSSFECMHWVKNMVQRAEVVCLKSKMYRLWAALVWHGKQLEGWNLLGYDTVIWWVVSHTSKDCSAPIFRVKHSLLLLEMLDPADEVTVLLQNVKNYSSSDTVSHPRRPKLHNTGVKSSSLIESRLSGYSLSYLRYWVLQFSESSKIYSDSATFGDSCTYRFQRLILSLLSGFWYDDIQSDHCKRTWTNGVRGEVERFLCLVLFRNGWIPDLFEHGLPGLA